MTRRSAERQSPWLSEKSLSNKAFKLNSVFCCDDDTVGESVTNARTKVLQIKAATTD
ncbi:hypothetical protein [Nostoc sp.]|uniref:hypothetical protein n=1 Tax=Nostoc sp. TaxID=1180 RepID=UPI002FF649EC